MYLTLHSFSLKLCSPTIELKTSWCIPFFSKFTINAQFAMFFGLFVTLMSSGCLTGFIHKFYTSFAWVYTGYTWTVYGCTIESDYANYSFNIHQKNHPQISTSWQLLSKLLETKRVRKMSTYVVFQYSTTRFRVLPFQWLFPFLHFLGFWSLRPAYCA